ncbi:hypothetical protein [Nonomuraea sp. NPDC049709]
MTVIASLSLSLSVPVGKDACPVRAACASVRVEYGQRRASADP